MPSLRLVVSPYGVSGLTTILTTIGSHPGSSTIVQNPCSEHGSDSDGYPRTRSRRLGVKGSQVQILSSRREETAGQRRLRSNPGPPPTCLDAEIWQRV
jgi:hypothetical protein